ncbi:response regulator [Effusibacillus lacus]|uniref:Response regulator n=1 Tax=Effusibacillus lacus TaxID=1348429 RepID=A0A292YRY6_9BACL|nr:response regulator [Effusibacillus lacus]TCS76842.1 two-component system chemotaxis response regulator CheY [Effusibacillus lacus]GAX91174.1 response regulator [Effusibacillus lacus]
MAKKVLIVDDAAFMRMMLRKILSDAGFAVIEAVNGRDAVEKYRLVRPDVVTMDITMPDMTGIEAVQAIIALDPAAKILMCSAMGQQAMVIEAIQSGAKGFLVKPFDGQRVIEEVSKLAEKE